MLRFWWISFIVVWSYCGQASNGQKPIPRQLAAFLHNATSFAELEQRIKVLPTSRSSSGSQTTFGRARGGGVGGISPSAGRSRSSGSGIPHFGGGVTVIEDPKQSQDSCKIVNICVALPVMERTGIFLFPKCIELPQCLGGCCTNGDNCHAVDTENIKVKYKTWRLVDESSGVFDFIGESLVDMKKHKSCGCSQCTEKPVCNDRQEIVNCQCQCKNLDEKGMCQGANHRWSDEKCECTCDRTCPSSTFLNKRTCSCDSIRSYDSPSSGENWSDDTDNSDRMGANTREQNVHFDGSKRPSYGTTRDNRRYSARPRP